MRDKELKKIIGPIQAPQTNAQCRKQNDYLIILSDGIIFIFLIFYQSTILIRIN